MRCCLDIPGTTWKTLTVLGQYDPNWEIWIVYQVYNIQIKISQLGSYWNSSTLATSCEELAHWKRVWCWDGLGAGGEGDDRRWDGWMASLTRWTWIWVNSGSWWWAGRPGVLRFMGSQRVRHDWVTKLNWTETWYNNLSRETLFP